MADVHKCADCGVNTVSVKGEQCAGCRQKTAEGVLGTLGKIAQAVKKHPKGAPGKASDSGSKGSRKGRK